MNLFVRAEVAAMAVMFLLSSWGCGSSTSAPTTGPEVFHHAAMDEVANLYRASSEDAKKPPTKVANVSRYEIGLPSGYQELKNGNIIVYWGAPLSDSAANSILAYEKTTPESGGYVLMQDGSTIKKMTPEEFKAAPKAGALKAGGK